MNGREAKVRFLNRTTLKIFGILLILLAAFVLLWRSNATSNQAIPALVAQVYFDGEYRIADGPWQQIVEGEHIPSTKGDVILRSNFHMLAPDGEYVGVYSGDMPIALYTDHIHLTFYTGENELYTMDIENPLYGSSFCGVHWSAYCVTSEKPIEIRIHNPHSFGNETAIDELLSGVAFWSGLDLKHALKAVQAEEVFQHDTPYYRIDTNLVKCDYLSFLATGKPEFHGEYMTQYSWAEATCAMLQFKQ